MGLYGRQWITPPWRGPAIGVLNGLLTTLALKEGLRFGGWTLACRTQSEIRTKIRIFCSLNGMVELASGGAAVAVKDHAHIRLRGQMRERAHVGGLVFAAAILAMTVESAAQVEVLRHFAVGNWEVAAYARDGRFS
ncbi:MAG: hypothetical protein K2Y71_03960 [Xanthobacteraceae bacterium]|nr:hypothetical protein [Xanthobacteraceae bacterium]